MSVVTSKPTNVKPAPSDNKPNASDKPDAYRPYSRCDCNKPEACGAPDIVPRKGVGVIPNFQRPFAVWDGRLNEIDGRKRPVKAYVPPPAYPYLNCDRPLPGAQACAWATGADRCSP